MAALHARAESPVPDARPAKRPDGWPTRAAVEWWSPAEKAITDAMKAVEATPGGSLALTDAVILLQRARDRVADHMEGAGEKIEEE